MRSKVGQAKYVVGSSQRRRPAGQVPGSREGLARKASQHELNPVGLDPSQNQHLDTVGAQIVVGAKAQIDGNDKISSSPARARETSASGEEFDDYASSQ